MFVGSLYALTQHIGAQGRGYGVEGHALSVGGGHYCLSMGRQQALDFALKHGFTHLLFLDDDMVFPPTILQRLISRKLPVVGANYVTKSEKPLYVARDAQGKRVSSKGRTGVEEVARHGYFWSSCRRCGMSKRRISRWYGIKPAISARIIISATSCAAMASKSIRITMQRKVSAMSATGSIPWMPLSSPFP